MVSYEYERVYRQEEEDHLISELIKENHSLKTLLLINHDFFKDIETRIAQVEEETRALNSESDGDTHLKMPDNVKQMIEDRR